MTGAILKISEQFGTEKTVRTSSKQAWAAYVRRRWPQNAVCHAQAEWDLTDGQARGLVFGHASQPTIDAIVTHRRGGPLLALKVEALAWGMTWEAFIERAIEEEKREIEIARRQLNQQDERARLAWASVRRRGADLRAVDRHGDQEGVSGDRATRLRDRGLGDHET